MEARVVDLMELQEAAKSRRRGVVEKAKSVIREEGSSTSWREKRAADDTEEAPKSRGYTFSFGNVRRMAGFGVRV